MKAFTSKLKDFFKLNTASAEENFCENKRKLLIPLYQREYKWEDDKIFNLISDITSRDKFLGIIILDEKQECYEIIDGQQRITTCFLTLLVLYNHYDGSPMEQRDIWKYIQPYGDYVLKNDSVGEYIEKEADKLNIRILPQYDVYYQKERFEKAFEIISKKIALFTESEVREFKNKLLDCEFVVLVHNEDNATRPVEQVFLDINEKVQVLEVADIFKGHCFKNYADTFDEELKQSWVELKKCGMGFKNYFRYKDLSQYIYLYLLENKDTNLPENLVVGGKHILDSKTMDETKAYLQAMIAYGNNVLSFRENINKNDYKFADICKDSASRANTNDHLVLKNMSMAILDYSKAQYQKLPFMQLINELSVNETLKTTLPHDTMRSIVTNLYVYTMLFVGTGGRKSKKDIDCTVKNALDNENIGEISTAAKNLRKNKVTDFFLAEKENFERLCSIYTVMDHYSPERNWIDKFYCVANGYNLEHFVIPDQKKGIVVWQDGAHTQNIVIPSELIKTYKNSTYNFLILDKNLNEELKNFDLPTKIEKIKSWYTSRNEAIPKHINLFIEAAEHLPSYQKLLRLKGQDGDEAALARDYKKFIEEYFEEAKRQILHQKIVRQFQRSFRQ